MNILNVQNLHKTYGTRVVFDGVAFAVDEGEKVGFIGANGAGKSTLFRIVAGVEGVGDGTLAIQRGATVGYLAQEPTFAPGDTIHSAAAAGNPSLHQALAEYQKVAAKLAAGSSTESTLARQGELTARIEALGGWDWEHRVEAMLTRLGVGGWERSVEGLSGGERKRVALARVLLQRPDLLLLDEPTNHLDADTTLWLEGHLAAYAGAVMLITHDRYFLDRVVSRMIEVSRGELTSYPGGYTEYLEARAEHMDRLAVEEGKRAKLIDQELAWVKRSPSARTGKQKARVNRLADRQAQHASAESSRQAVAEMRFGDPPRLGRTVLDLEHISKSFGERNLIRDFSTILRAGERIGIIGPNGAGKTTLLRIILGEEDADEGRVVLGKNSRIAYFDQRREDLDPDSSIYEAVADEDWVMVAGNRVHLRSYLEGFLFPVPMQSQKVRSLSGGERNRVLLARLLLQDANLLILDEPTNDLDLVTLQVLEATLADFPGCVLVVTHDRFFLDKVATGLFVFEEGGVVHRHEGGYELYRRLTAQAAADRQTAPSVTPKAASARPKKPGGPRLSYREKKELEAMEEAILAAEDERDRIGALLADPQLYTRNPEQVAELTAAFRTAGDKVEHLYARWAELEEKRGEG
ncbi:MAG TPA: ABC-F family ATP-binding cassette domain-containing protein [Longimicrobiaceae bacterium]|nr:ABC-F family ATP-binding cassette domain-containing protein [Longimicrobiaceae bacterium]